MRLNHYQRRTPPRKLQGQFFTPDWLADLVVERTVDDPWGLAVDPACGDGVFLKAVVRRRAKELAGRRRSRAETSRLVLSRLVGLDVDPTCVASARRGVVEAFRAATGFAPTSAPEVHAADVLSDAEGVASDFRRGRGLFEGGADYVLGNPPYVEAKRMARALKERLRRAHPGAGVGPVDLFVYVTHVALDALSPTGRLAFVLPNKTFVARYAQNLRRRLLTDRPLEEIVLLSHLPVFERVAVYPVVVRATRRAASPDVTQHWPVPPDAPGAPPAAAAAAAPAAPPDVVRVPRRLYADSTSTCSFFPVPRRAGPRRLLERLVERAGEGRVGDSLDVRWTVSFHEEALRDEFVFAARPGRAHERPFVGGPRFAGNGEVQPYRLTWGGAWIDYDEARARARGNAFPPRSLFDRDKLAICQNATRLRCAVDRRGHVLKDTFLAGVPAADGGPLARDLDALAALLNSDALHFYYAHVFMGGHVGGGYLHFLAPYVRDLPAGRWDEAAVAEVGALARAASEAPAPGDVADLDRRIQRVVEDALRLTAAERRILDDGWRR